MRSTWPITRVLALATILICGPLAGCQPGPSEADKQRTVLVTGATGTQGGAVARELLSRGWQVRALTRNPGQPAAMALERLGATVVQGDFDDPDSLEAAMDGVYGLFAVTDFWEHGYDREITHGKALVVTAKSAGVEHLVYTSVASANQATGVPHFDSKYEVEQYLQASGLPYTIIRPVSFMDNWVGRREEFLGGEFVNPGASEQTHQWIAASDIGFFAAEAFDSPDQWRGTATDIAGDEMQLAELVAMLAAILERPVVYREISFAEDQARYGEELAIMHRWFEETGYSVDIPALRQAHPGLKTAEQFLREIDWE